ncbi:MAG: GtrA family protein [Anaerovoracaceae bacterium]|jgi:putative flippase GtrA
MNKIRKKILQYREVVSYLIVGGLTTLVSMGTYYLCIFTVFDPHKPLLLQAANVISWIFAVTFAYFTNRKYVFRSHSRQILREAASFYAGRLGTLLMEMGLMWLTVTMLGWSAVIMKIVVQVVITIANYIISKKLVFIKDIKRCIKQES